MIALFTRSNVYLQQNSVIVTHSNSTEGSYCQYKRADRRIRALHSYLKAEGKSSTNTMSYVSVSDHLNDNRPRHSLFENSILIFYI